MEREAFLDAQLWLRKLSPDDALLSLPARTIGSAPPPRAEEERGGLFTLLPPESREEGLSADAQPSSPPVPAVSWCCFQLGARYCFFRADEEGQDPTQLQIEILLAKVPAPRLADASDAPLIPPVDHLLLRFEKKLVYEVDPALILSVTHPKECEPTSSASNPSSQESGRRQQPPYGSLQCGAVSLRIWMDPEQMAPGDAAHKLQFALFQVNMLRGRCGKKKERRAPSPSWKDTFRHNLDVSGLATACSSTSLSKTSPARFLEKMKAVLSTSGDLEAVKMVIDKIVRARRQRGGHDRGRSQSSSQGETYTPAVVVIDSESKSEDGPNSSATAEGALFSDMEIVVLVTELTHLFGEDHAGVNQLLVFTHGDASTLCGAHDRCYKCSGTEGSLSCATSKWAAWDEFLEGSHQVLMQSRKRQRVEGPPSDQAPPMDGRTQAAVDSFCRAIVEKDDYAQWSRHHRHAKSQISAMERTAFRALGLLPARAEPDTSASGTNGQVGQQAGQEQRLMMTEQVFAALLHKRRQLARDELVLELLPCRL